MTNSHGKIESMIFQLWTFHKWNDHFDIDQRKNDYKHKCANNKGFKGGNPKKRKWMSTFHHKSQNGNNHKKK